MSDLERLHYDRVINSLMNHISELQKVVRQHDHHLRVLAGPACAELMLGNPEAKFLLKNSEERDSATP